MKRTLVLAAAAALAIQSTQALADGYAAVWRPGTGAQWWRSGMSFDEFKAQDLTYFNQGLRITVLEVNGGRYAAVWRPGAGAQWWRSGMSGPQMESQDQTYFAQGLRLTAMA